METLVDVKTNSVARTFHAMKASAEEEIPTRIEILKAGTWPASSSKGPLVITTDDLIEMKQNFDAGIGMAGGAGFGLPIDFMHEEWDKAGGWIKSLEVEGMTLFANVEWSKAGQDAIINKEFKCISPSFYPGCLGMWSDPEDADITARNVLIGAGLTNIPFFKDLKPIMASRVNESEEKNIIYVVKETKKENEPMVIDEVRVIDADKLTEEQKTFLVDHKDELTDEEKTKFGFEVTPAPAPAPVSASATPAQGVVDKSEEMVQVSASRLASLEASAKSYETDKALSIVKAHVTRGAIRADKESEWVERLVKANASDRALLEDTLTALPDNPALEASKGSKDTPDAKDAVTEVREKAQEKIKASREAGKEIDVRTAYAEVLKENKELAERYASERGE